MSLLNVGPEIGWEADPAEEFDDLAATGDAGDLDESLRQK